MVTPLTEQLPPPGSVYTGPPLMISADALDATPNTARLTSAAIAPNERPRAR
jgi:hypothetical protein